MIAFTFIISFFLGVANGNVDANMSALLVAGIGTISDILSEKYKSSLDPTANDDDENFTLLKP
jgi:hypothetical protein